MGKQVKCESWWVQAFDKGAYCEGYETWLRGMVPDLIKGAVGETGSLGQGRALIPHPQLRLS